MKTTGIARISRETHEKETKIARFHAPRCQQCICSAFSVTVGIQACSKKLCASSVGQSAAMVPKLLPRNHSFDIDSTWIFIDFHRFSSTFPCFFFSDFAWISSDSWPIMKAGSKLKA